MFLFDPAVTAEWEQIKTELDRLMARSDAKIIVCGKWDERRLAYEIGGRKRAIYVLSYFQAEPDKIVGMERDIRLAESIIRCLILRADHVSEEEMKKAVAGPALPPTDNAPGEGGRPGSAPGRGEAEIQAEAVTALTDPEDFDAIEE